MKLFPSRLWKQAVSLLQPHAADCSFCGKPISGRGSSSVTASEQRSPTTAGFSRQVCASCMAGIPWVRRIVCPICGRGEYCPDCPRRAAAHFVCNRSAVRYDDRMRGWLALYKYRGQEHLEELFADMLMQPLQTMAKQLNAGLPATNRRGRLLSRANAPALAWDAITFVPVSRVRAEERGFNQAERLAEGVSARTGIPVADLLRRTRHTGKQSFKTRGERMDNTKDLFQADFAAIAELHGHAPSSRPLRLLLIDDIYTTGSTIEACSAALQKASPFPLRIYALTWARS